MAQTQVFGFENLEAYQAARAFRNKVYAMCRQLPDEEKYGAASQMRRASLSITSNIAEGYARYTWQDTTRLFHVARGSVAELVDQLGLCLDMAYLSESTVEELRRDAVKVAQLINGYIRYLQARKGRGPKD